MSDLPKRLFALIGTVVSMREATKRMDGRAARPYVDLLVGTAGDDPVRAHIALTDELFAQFRKQVKPAMTIELNGYLDSVPFFDDYVSELVAGSVSILKPGP